MANHVYEIYIHKKTESSSCSYLSIKKKNQYNNSIRLAPKLLYEPIKISKNTNNAFNFLNFPDFNIVPNLQIST